MQSKRSIWLAVAALLAIAYPGMADAPTQPLLAQLTPSPTALAEMVQVTGEVKLKRRGQEYRLARAGEPLQFGDLLKVGKGSRGTIRCAVNRSTWTVPDDNLPWGVANVCPAFGQSASRPPLN
jgi:hypothetical protein